MLTFVGIDATGNLYLAGCLNNRVRKVDTAGTITTIAGAGAQRFSGDGGPATSATLNLPVDVVADSAGNVYIADWINFRIRKVDSTGVIQTRVGTGGSGYTGERVAPNLVNVFASSVTVDASGRLDFGDSGSYPGSHNRQVIWKGPTWSTGTDPVWPGLTPSGTMKVRLI